MLLRARGRDARGAEPVARHGRRDAVTALYMYRLTHRRSVIETEKGGRRDEAAAGVSRDNGSGAMLISRRPDEGGGGGSDSVELNMLLGSTNPLAREHAAAAMPRGASCRCRRTSCWRPRC